MGKLTLSFSTIIYFLVLGTCDMVSHNNDPEIIVPNYWYCFSTFNKTNTGQTLLQKLFSQLYHQLRSIQSVFIARHNHWFCLI